MRPTFLTAALLASVQMLGWLQGSAPMEFAGLILGEPRTAAVRSEVMQDCRVAATEATTRTKGPGFTATTTTTCRFDKGANTSTCTNKYNDSFGTVTSAQAVTTFRTAADAVDEIRVIPPRRRSLRTDTTTQTAKGPTTSSLVNSYDAQNRLLQETGDSAAGTFTTTYTSWDAAGRPTAGRTVTRGGTNDLTLAYDDRARTVTTTTETNGLRLVCVMTFDANGNPVDTSCKAPDGTTNSSTTKTAATEKICR